MNLNCLWKKTTHRLQFPIFLRSVVSVIFFGSDHYSLPHLHALEERQRQYKDIKIVCVVTTSDKTPVGDHCIQSKIDHVIWPRTISNTSIIVDCINQRINAIKNQSSDQSNKLLGIIVSFGRFLPASLLSLFNYGCYNIHPSLLPRWKGPTPLLYTLLSRDKVTGITLFRLDPTHTTFDSGSVVYQQSIRLPHNKSIFLTPEQLVVYLIPHSIKAMFEVILHPNLPYLIGIEQSVISEKFHIPITYTRKPKTQVGAIDWWKQSAKDIICCWYALQGSSINLYTELDLSNIKVDDEKKHIDDSLIAHFRLTECPLLVPDGDFLSKNNNDNNDCNYDDDDDRENINVCYANYDPKTMNYLNEASILLNQPYSSSLPPGSVVYLRSQIDSKHPLIPYAFIACKPNNIGKQQIQEEEDDEYSKVSWIAVKSFLVKWPSSSSGRHLTAIDVYNGYFINYTEMMSKLPFIVVKEKHLGVRYFGQFQCLSSSSLTFSIASFINNCTECSNTSSQSSKNTVLNPWTKLTPSILPNNLQLSSNISNIVHNVSNK